MTNFDHFEDTLYIYFSKRKMKERKKEYLAVILNVKFFLNFYLKNLT